ncbi:MAG: MOSC domain-containing protein [Streptosporangiaceae bacterium]|nr:MOSC domain-containing protein [Streptosporangiaceae bacterium]MBV9857547.1 MOSC domain-containing protein [Streptosporangiaceae bacterium]
MPLSVNGIYRYPLKSCRGERREAAAVEPWGLAGDRRWMIVDADGDAVTARKYPQLLLVTPYLNSDSITLSTPAAEDLTVPVPRGDELVPVSVWDSELPAALACDAAADWLSQVVGEPVRLVYLDDPTRRRPDPSRSREGDRVSFADAYPLLLTSQASLVTLNELIAGGPRAAEGPLPMTRFRPNVVVAGAPAWAEDTWRLLRIGDVVFRVTKGCDRCVLTTIDPATAAKGKEPITTLAKYRRWDGKVWFGINLIPDSPRPGDTIKIGDPVEILEQAAPNGPRHPSGARVLSGG